ncbi:MAG TPA: cupin domain-containing protein, partial [Abditibacterium sp.]
MNLHPTSVPLDASLLQSTSLLPTSFFHAEPLRNLMVRPGEGHCFEWDGQRVEILLTKQQSGGHLGVAVIDVPEGAGPPLHVHECEDEIFNILSGRFEFRIRDSRVEVGRGDVVFAPRGVAHTFKSLENGSRMCVSFTPGGFEGYFAACAPLFASGAPDMSEMARLSAKFGVTFLNAYDEILEATLQPTLQCRVVRADEGALMGPPGERGRRALSPGETGGLLVGEIEVDAGFGPPPHVHTAEDEVFLVSEGRFEFWTGDGRFEAGPGTLVYGPRDLPHTWRALGETPGRVWAWVLPGEGFQAFFEAYGTMLQGEAPDPHAITRL